MEASWRVTSIGTMHFHPTFLTSAEDPLSASDFLALLLVGPTPNTNLRLPVMLLVVLLLELPGGTPTPTTPRAQTVTRVRRRSCSTHLYFKCSPACGVQRKKTNKKKANRQGRSAVTAARRWTLKISCQRALKLGGGTAVNGARKQFL